MRDSDATLIVSAGALRGGSRLTRTCCRGLAKPYRVVDVLGAVEIEDLRKWLADNRVAVLNVAGPRESHWPGVYALARDLLLELLK